MSDSYFQHSQVSHGLVATFRHKVAISESKLATLIQESQSRPGDDLTLLEQYPMIEIVPGRYICIDPGFLVEKAGRGLYWALFSEATPSLKEKLPGFWGAVFEAYVNSIIQRSHAGKGRFIPEPKFSNGDLSFDACIVEGRDLIVFEHKSSVIRADAKYGGDVSKLEAQLRLKFVEGDDKERKGVAQLSRNLTRFLGGEILADLNCKSFSRVFPVMVCLESSVTAPYMAKYFREKFKVMFPRKNFSQVVTPLFTLSVSELENLLGYLASLALPDILESYYLHNKNMLSSLSNSDVPLLKNVETGKNMVMDRFLTFTQRMEKNFFGENAALEGG
jgi:hypothetical protein